MSAHVEILCPLCSHRLSPGRPGKCSNCAAALQIGEIDLSPLAVHRLNQAVKATRYPFEAWDLVFRSARRAVQRSSFVHGETSGSPQAVCRCFRELAHLTYLNRTNETLRGWGLRSSEDIFEIIRQLAVIGFFRAEDSDSHEAYRGIFVVGDAYWTAVDPLRGKCRQCGYDLCGTPTRVCPECNCKNWW
jgi:uncharacterized repeat protein (TIGR04138 family)